MQSATPGLVSSIRNAVCPVPPIIRIMLFTYPLKKDRNKIGSFSNGTQQLSGSVLYCRAEEVGEEGFGKDHPKPSRDLNNHLELTVSSYKGRGKKKRV